MSVLRTQIRVKLGAVGQNALGTSWATLDLPDNFTLRLSKDVQSLSDVNSLLTDGVLPFSVPFSTTNDIALNAFSSPLILDRNPDGLEARVHVDGHELPFDTVFFRTKDSSRKSWELELRRSPNHWLSLASEKRLCTTDYGSETLDAATVEAGWEQPAYDAGGAVTSLVRWMVADFGGWVDLAEPIQFTDPPVKGVWLEDLRPVYSVPETLRRNFCDIGWALEGLILETEYVKRLWQYVLKRDFYTESRGGAHKTIVKETINGFFLDQHVPPGITGVVPFTNTVQYDPGSNAILYAAGKYWPGVTNSLGYKSRWKFCFSGFVKNTNIASDTFWIRIGEFDPVANDLTYIYFPDPLLITQIGAGEEVYAKGCIEVDLEPGQSACMLLWANTNPGSVVEVQKGYQITIEPHQSSLVRGDTPDLKRLIDCELTLLDMFKGFLHLINGRVKTDWNTRTVTVYPFRGADVFGDDTPGFIDDSEVIDLTGKVVCGSTRLSPVKNDLRRYTRLLFAETTDAYISELDPAEPPHSRKVLNGLELPDQVQDRENPFWEPTVERQPDVLKRVGGLFFDNESPYFPVMADNLTGERSFNIRPRIFYHFGSVRQLDDPAPDISSPAFYFEGSATQLFGYLTQRRTLALSTSTVSVVPPEIDGSIVFGTLPFDLYTTFYIGLSQINKRGMWADLLVLMDMNEWNRWDFTTPFLFQYEGRQVLSIGENIRDFAPGAGLPTPMRLLVEPNVSECCDQPCSCRYIECDYFQDFGQFMLQSTIDSLSVTSFKVDGIEQLEAPAEFGIMNVVSIVSKPFVTNLVDTLNGLEIPYFSFRPSEKDYPDKDDLRFFKIKRPACQAFRIEISDGSEVAYFYSDTAMGSSWFIGSGFEPMGYAGDPVSEPQDCVTSVEY